MCLLAVTAAARAEDRSAEPEVGVALRSSRLLLAEATDRHSAGLVQYLLAATAARRFCPAFCYPTMTATTASPCSALPWRVRVSTPGAAVFPHRCAHEQDP